MRDWFTIADKLREFTIGVTIFLLGMLVGMILGITATFDMERLVHGNTVNYEIQGHER